MRFIWKRFSAHYLESDSYSLWLPVMEGANTETRNSCAMIHPNLLPFVKECLFNDALNTQGGILEIKRPRTSSLVYEGGKSCDRFTVGIPYCGTQIEWEVIFDRNHPTQPPDVIFSPQDELLEFDPDVDKLKCFSRWNGRNPSCLSDLLQELLSEYRSHHRALACQYQRLNFEMQTLLDSGQFQDVDVHCTRRTDSNSFEPIAKFYVPLKINFSTIPAYIVEDSPGPDEAALVVTFIPPNGAKVSPSLFLSPRIERILGGSKQLKLPPWGSDMCLMDYAPLVHQLLDEKVQSLVQSYVQRKEFTAAFVSVFGQAVLEYDTEDFKILSFLFEHSGFTFVTKLELSDDYPQEQPRLVLQSVYHTLQDIPCHSIVGDYPYSPRWSADEQADRMRAYLISIAPQFKELSKEKGAFL